MRGRAPTMPHGMASVPSRRARRFPSHPDTAMRHPIESVCLIAQSDYQIDPRVRRKAEALVAAGYSVDVLALRPPDGEKSYTLNGVNVRTMSLKKKRGSVARYIYEYAAFFLWACFHVTRQMQRRRYAVIDINTLPDFL